MHGAAVLLCLLPVACTSPPGKSDLPPLREADFSTVLWPAVKQAYAKVQASPRDPEANGKLAMVLHAGAKYQLGEVFYRRAIAQDRSFRWLYYLSQLQTLSGARDEARLTLEQALQLEPRYVPALIKSARLMLDAARPADAQAVLEKAAALDPQSPIVEFELGRVRSALGDRKGAIPHWERALSLHPEYGPALYALAMAYRAEGRTADAKARLALYESYQDRLPTQKDPLEAEFLAAVQGGSGGGRSNLEMASAALKRGDLPGAARSYEAELARDPSNMPLHSSLIAVYYKMGQFQKAEARYAGAMRVNPNFADAHYHYGMALLAQGKAREAAAAFGKAVASQGTHAGALTQLGLLREKAGDDTAAVEYYRQALANEPSQRQGSFLLGRQLVRRKKYPEGIAYLEKTIEPDDEQSPWFLRALAGAHDEAGHSAKAQELFERARVKATARGDKRILPLLDQDLASLRQRVKPR